MSKERSGGRRVTGIGGIFFKCKDPEQIRQWYAEHLGIAADGESGAVFKWFAAPDDRQPRHTIWSPFSHDSGYFGPSEKPFMFNYRVENLVELIEALRAEGVPIVGEIEEYSYGKFGWIMDPEGNKIELWEPVDSEFTPPVE